MNLRLFSIPYDSGQRNIRMGEGPEHLMKHGAKEDLETLGHQVWSETIEAVSEFYTEVGTSIELYRTLAQRVRAAISDGWFPLVLSGNCGSCLGTLSGLDHPRPGIIWLDAHGDFNTPETTLSGFFDGMALATATGRCWTALTSTIRDFVPTPESHIIHLGARDLDPQEGEMLDESEIAVVSARQVRDNGLASALTPALVQLRERVSKVYLHLDLDVLDSDVAVANGFAAAVPGGLSVEQVREAIRLIGERFTIVAAAVSAFDPNYDSEARALLASGEILWTVGEQIDKKAWHDN